MMADDVRTKGKMMADGVVKGKMMADGVRTKGKMMADGVAGLFSGTEGFASGCRRPL